MQTLPGQSRWKYARKSRKQGVIGDSGIIFPLLVGPKAYQLLRVAHEFIRQELQGDEPAERSVFCLIDDTHASATKFPDNPEVRKRFVHRCEFPNGHNLPNPRATRKWMFNRQDLKALAMEISPREISVAA